MKFNPNELSEWVYVAPSPIHGLGLYAKKPIEKGQYIGSYVGPIRSYHPDQDYDHTYILWLEDEQGWLGMEGQNILRYINHARSCNAFFSGWDLYALKPIAAGEEITFDYGEEFDPSMD